MSYISASTKKVNSRQRAFLFKNERLLSTGPRNFTYAGKKRTIDSESGLGTVLSISSHFRSPFGIITRNGTRFVLGNFGFEYQDAQGNHICYYYLDSQVGRFYFNSLQRRGVFLDQV